jgi:hypothetical protein
LYAATCVVCRNEEIRKRQRQWQARHAIIKPCPAIGARVCVSVTRFG